MDDIRSQAWRMNGVEMLPLLQQT